MLDNPDLVFGRSISPDLQVQLVILATIAATLLAVSGLLALARALRQRWPQIREIYDTAIAPRQGFVRTTGYLLAIDVVALILATRIPAVGGLELYLGLAFAICLGTLLYRVFQFYFQSSYLSSRFKKSEKLNSELLVLVKFAVGLGIYVAVLIVFLEVHHINVLSLFAGLGIGGLAIAFAAQKTLEQFLGGVVLYVDRPFVEDDYIGLPDGTFGRVESIGWRSTKIRTSGKGTLVVIPNSGLTQVAVENFTGAKKMMAIVNFTFLQSLGEEERALVRQVVADSTKTIFGLDSRNTDVTFADGDARNTTDARITFFILGTGAVSMDLRVQVLDLANQAIAERLQTYNLPFTTEESTVYVDSPIAV